MFSFGVPPLLILLAAPLSPKVGVNTTGWEPPSVSVPVLSSTTAVIRAAPSRVAASLMRIWCFAPSPVPTATAAERQISRVEEGWSLEEIAAHSGAPLNTVRSQLFRARAALKAALETMTRNLDRESFSTESVEKNRAGRSVFGDSDDNRHAGR